jgi:hypothetical protein
MKLLVRERWPELSMMKAAAPQNRSPINRVGVAGARPGLEQRRFLSLYYGSLGWLRAAQALSCWAAGVIISAERRREELETAVRCQLGQGAVFSTGSARSALSSCLQAAGIGAGDEVLLSAYTCLAVPTAVIAAGATPVYADINAATLNVDADTWIAALSPRVRAVVVQHTLGKPASIEVVAAAARARGILVIEDCALSIGSSIDGRAVGTFGDAAIFSMELSKTLSCGWGGVLVVHQPELAGAMRERYAGLDPGCLADGDLGLVFSTATIQRDREVRLSRRLQEPAVSRLDAARRIRGENSRGFRSKNVWRRRSPRYPPVERSQESRRHM